MEFIQYNGSEIMYMPADGEYTVEDEYHTNDEVFGTLEAAQEYIDQGSPMSAKTINAYRHGAMEESKNKKTMKKKISLTQLQEHIKREAIKLHEAEAFGNDNDVIVINENFASQEFYDGENAEATEYLQDQEYNHHTVELDHNSNTIRIYKDVSGLDAERDQVDPEDMSNYMEMTGEEIMDVISGGMQPSMISGGMDEISWAGIKGAARSAGGAIRGAGQQVADAGRQAGQQMATAARGAGQSAQNAVQGAGADIKHAYKSAEHTSQVSKQQATLAQLKAKMDDLQKQYAAISGKQYKGGAVSSPAMKKNAPVRAAAE